MLQAENVVLHASQVMATEIDAANELYIEEFREYILKFEIQSQKYYY
jgi:hypothetical protein